MQGRPLEETIGRCCVVLLVNEEATLNRASAIWAHAHTPLCPECPPVCVELVNNAGGGPQAISLTLCYGRIDLHRPQYRQNNLFFRRVRVSEQVCECVTVSDAAHGINLPLWHCLMCQSLISIGPEGQIKVIESGWVSARGGGPDTKSKCKKRGEFKDSRVYSHAGDCLGLYFWAKC